MSEACAFTLNDVQRAARKIRDACPHVYLDNHSDYGFQLVALPNGRGKPPALILFKPSRFEGEASISSTPEQIDASIKEWRGR